MPIATAIPRRGQIQRWNARWARLIACVSFSCVSWRMTGAAPAIEHIGPQGGRRRDQQDAGPDGHGRGMRQHPRDARGDERERDEETGQRIKADSRRETAWTSSWLDRVVGGTVKLDCAARGKIPIAKRSGSSGRRMRELELQVDPARSALDRAIGAFNPSRPADDGRAPFSTSVMCATEGRR